MKKLEAIEYLVENSVYNNEWSGAGMWEAVLTVMSRTSGRDFTKEYLDGLLKKAEDF